MADTRTPAQRSRIMKSVKTAHTGPEIAVRRVLHNLGYRFRLHRKDLPGRPDIVLPRFKTAIFVHGCFWHGHKCAKGRPPKSRKDYWIPKILGNRARDRRNLKALDVLGWEYIIVWQCETRNITSLRRLLVTSLGRFKRKTEGKHGSTDRD
jgi:DNA mismatch endonuclease (patch repair protein)